MRSIVGCITAACIATLSGASAAEPTEVDESTRWVPSLAITSGLIADGSRGQVSSTVRPGAFGSGSQLAPWLGGSLEIMSPAWASSRAGRPRAFIHAGLAANFGFERDLAKEGSPGGFIAPTIPGIANDDLVQGQGSTTSAQPAGFQATAGAGVAFTLDTSWRRIRIKPSVEYLLEQIDVRGRVHRARVNDPAIPSYDLFAITGIETEYFHGIGPGLEIEADISRAGPFVVALLASGGAYYVLGDRYVGFSAVDATATENATFEYRKHPWSYRAHVGFRFRWAPRGR